MSKTWKVLFQNKFEILMHLVGFIIRIYHYARSSEPQFAQDVRETRMKINLFLEVICLNSLKFEFTTMIVSKIVCCQEINCSLLIIFGPYRLA